MPNVTIVDRMLPMSDGVRLFTRTVLPGDGSGTYPTVFTRSPYEKETTVTPEIVGRWENSPFLRRGFAVVQQHCRGRHGSEGACIPYSAEERRDGLETLAWLRNEKHYNGEVYFSGGSYTASVLLLMLDEPIPDLMAVRFAVQTESMYHRNYVNGMCRSFCGFSWWLTMISGQRPKIAQDAEIYRRPYRDIMRRATGEDLPAFTNGLLHDRYDDFWKDDPRIGVIEKLRVPTLLIGGWFDFYCYGMCSMWEKLSPETRAKSCFLMGPWGHGMKVRPDGDYPLPHAELPDDVTAAWFESVRDRKPFPYAAPGRFRFYRIGEACWSDAKSPYAVKPSRRFCFSADGTLVPKAPVKGECGYEYDPEHPKHHDRHDDLFLCDPPGRAEDVLSFVSAPFEADTRFFGAVEYRLTLRSDCEDTAFFLRLYLVEDGKSFNLVDGASTMLHADPSFQPGVPSRITIRTQPTAFTVRRGAAIRVDLSSASDCFAPHANTKEHFALAVETRVAHNALLCGDSVLLLPEDA